MYKKKNEIQNLKKKEKNKHVLSLISIPRRNPGGGGGGGGEGITFWSLLIRVVNIITIL